MCAPNVCDGPSSVSLRSPPLPLAGEVKHTSPLPLAGEDGAQRQVREVNYQILPL